MLPAEKRNGHAVAKLTKAGKFGCGFGYGVTEEEFTAALDGAPKGTPVGKVYHALARRNLLRRRLALREAVPIDTEPDRPEIANLKTNRKVFEGKTAALIDSWESQEPVTPEAEANDKVDALLSGRRVFDDEHGEL